MLARARTAARIYILGEGKGSEDIYTTHYLCIVDLETYQSSEVFDESLWRRLVANGDDLARGGPTTARLSHHALQALSLLSRGPDGTVALNLWKVAKFDAVTSITVARFYPELDRAFPGSKFILTTRDAESWSVSMRRNRRSQTLINLIPSAGQIFEEVYGTRSFKNMECLTERFQAHNREVQAYFASRPDDFLLLDVRDYDSWERLCHFLNRPVDCGATFPWHNRKYRTSVRDLADFVLP